MSQPYQRKTYKQLTESVTVKKGALWQEACDDGTQEYILLDQTFNKDPRQTQRIYDRELVEGDSKNFVEVFKVTPEYMTREELDKWEAFQGKKPASTAKAPTEKKSSRYSKEFLDNFVKAYNGSRTVSAVAKKLNVSRGTVINYRSAAVRAGYGLKAMPYGK